MAQLQIIDDKKKDYRKKSVISVCNVDYRHKRSGPILYLANITGTGKYAIVKRIWEVFLKKHLRLTNGLSIKCTNTTLRFIKIRTQDDLIFLLLLFFTCISSRILTP